MAKYYLDDAGVQTLVDETKEYVSGAVSEHANDSTAHLTSTEKTKLGNIEDGANKTVVDSSLSSSSTNPVQNKVVNSALAEKVPTTRTVNGKALSANITLSASDVGADASGTASTAVSNHNTSTSAHNDIRELITGLTTRLNTLADSDDTTLDQMSEVVAYIKANKELIESITTSKVNVSDIVNNLTTNVSTKPLSAAQGVAIKALIDALQTEVDAKALASDLTSHTGNTSNPHGVTKTQVGLGNVENVSVNNHAPTYSDTTTLATLASGEKLSVAFPKIKLAITNLINHIANVSNPHSVTKSQVGLGNVPNVTTNNQTPTYTEASSNAALVSGETLTTAFGKIAKAVSSLISHLANTSNPHSVTKSQIGLGNVENKSSATIRGELTKDNVTTALGYTPSATDTSYDEATTSVAGLMSAADKTKLDGIATGATKVTVDSALSTTSTNPVQNKVINSALSGKANTSHGNHVPTTETANNAKFLRNDNTWATVTPANIGAAATSHGNHVPATETANNAKFLRNDNTWQTVTPANIGAATTSHGTHVSYSSNVPVMDGTASVGSASTVSRSDHVHPTDTSRAAAEHEHDAGDITSGTLSVARGGTGKATLTSGQVLVGNGTGAVSQREIDTTAGGASGSTSLITSGAVYTGLSNMIGDDVTAADIAAIVV